MKAPRSLPASADQVAEVEAMIARLGELRRGSQDRALLGAYQAAIDRLEALAYRLGLPTAKARVIGLPEQAAPPLTPVPGPPQRSLPLGPVPAIVKARKPRR